MPKFDWLGGLCPFRGPAASENARPEITRDVRKWQVRIRGNKLRGERVNKSTCNLSQQVDRISTAA
jgi:hypothetical protein